MEIEEEKIKGKSKKRKKQGKETYNPRLLSYVFILNLIPNHLFPIAEGNLKQVKYLQTPFPFCCRFRLHLSFLNASSVPPCISLPLSLPIDILLKTPVEKAVFPNPGSQTFIIFVLENDVSILHRGG
ncbi:hypothetical protein TNCT_348831 [Trichonephila clavata]|uniref:Uncharacterized protein n=1 Tax=Trichonephila clavata TaxID=2740835 RepID=A0A8X6KTC8_TRICU|nr:hypothetical protein TNCT_348831 [Trichonephila clavata]